MELGSVSKIPSISDSMAQYFRSTLIKISTNISDTLVVEIPDDPWLELLSGEEIQRLNKEVNREAWKSANGKYFPILSSGAQVLWDKKVFINDQFLK